MMSESVVGTCVFVFIMEGTGVYYNVCVCVHVYYWLKGGRGAGGSGTGHNV